MNKATHRTIKELEPPGALFALAAPMTLFSERYLSAFVKRLLLLGYKKPLELSLFTSESLGKMMERNCADFKY